MTLDHKLFDIIFITVCATVAGCDDWASIVIFANERIEWFKQYCELPNGIPSRWTFQRVFQHLNSAALHNAFSNWMREIHKVSKGDIVAIDGKTLCGSFDTRNEQAAIHVVSAWASENRLVLGQLKTEAKSNEIKAIPQLLELLELSDAIITIDAMGCQKKMASIIREREADYVLAVKGNQENLQTDVELTFDVAEEKEMESFFMSEEGHGRIEKREYYQCQDLSQIRNISEWKDLRSLIKAVNYRVETNTGKMSIETRYFISSLGLDIKLAAKAIRGHWGIENNCHYTLDVVFKEDANRTRTDNGAENLSVVRHIAMNYLQQAKDIKCSIKNRRLKAALNTEILTKILKI
jgi:predicted transposase YbfD/YdcC